MISSPLRLEQPCVQKSERETTRRAGAANRLFIRMRYFFDDGGYKTNRIIKSFSIETRKKII